MSVAFRRESDDEHLEPRFELPLPPGPNHVTRRGLRLIAAQVAALEERLAAITDAEGRKVTLRDLRYWRTRHSTAELLPAPPAGEIGFGSLVRFRLRGVEREHRIVGSDEADPAAGLIVFTAPLAQAMMGLAAGDLGDFSGQADAIEIVAVEGGDDGEG